jgi:hypothetical protein
MLRVFSDQIENPRNPEFDAKSLLESPGSSLVPLYENFMSQKVDGNVELW